MKLAALCCDGKLQDTAAPTEMDIAWRPRIGGGFFYQPSGMLSQFSDSEWIRQHQIESCLAVAVKDQGGKTIGVIGLMHGQAMPDRSDDAMILSVFSARVAVELNNARCCAGLETAQALAENATRTKTALLTNLSHEIRTLMTSILGFTDYLENASGATRNNSLAIDAIRRSGKQLLSVIADADKASNSNIDALSEPVACAPRDIAAKAIAAFRTIAEEGGVALTQCIDETVPESIDTNPDEIHQILATMLEFALERGSKGNSSSALSSADSPRIQLQVKVEHGGVEFALSDSGESLDAAQLKALFDPPGESSVEAGVWTDLSQSQPAARRIGGTLCAETTPEGGATLTLHLPLPESQQELKPPQESRPASFLSACRVLVVEDGPDNMQLLCFLLLDEGAEVDRAENGQIGSSMAIEAAQAGRPYDVILMDMQMPVMDGYAATRLLRSQDYEHAIIAVTADSMSGDRERSLLAGCDDYISKPIDHDLLMDTIHCTLKPKAASPQT